MRVPSKANPGTAPPTNWFTVPGPGSGTPQVADTEQRLIKISRSLSRAGVTPGFRCRIQVATQVPSEPTVRKPLTGRRSGSHEARTSVSVQPEPGRYRRP